MYNNVHAVHGSFNLHVMASRNEIVRRQMDIPLELKKASAKVCAFCAICQSKNIHSGTKLEHPEIKNSTLLIAFCMDYFIELLTAGTCIKTLVETPVQSCKRCNGTRA